MFSLDFRVHSEVGRSARTTRTRPSPAPTCWSSPTVWGALPPGTWPPPSPRRRPAEGDRRLDNEHLVEHMAGIVQRANDKLADLIENNLELDGMGTTFSGAAFSGTMLGVAHIGDSRGYLLREGELKQLTHDHSWVQSLIDEGRITPEQAATHPHRSLILKVLNGAGDTDPDFFELPVLEGDRVLFCSDGLSGLMSEEDLHELMSLDDLDECVSRLSALANEHGGHDNISLVLAQVVPQSDELDAAEPQLAGSALERGNPHNRPRGGGPGLSRAGARRGPRPRLHGAGPLRPPGEQEQTPLAHHPGSDPGGGDRRGCDLLGGAGLQLFPVLHSCRRRADRDLQRPPGFAARPRDEHPGGTPQHPDLRSPGVLPTAGGQHDRVLRPRLRPGCGKNPGRVRDPLRQGTSAAARPRETAG